METWEIALVECLLFVGLAFALRSFVRYTKEKTDIEKAEKDRVTYNCQRIEWAAEHGPYFCENVVRDSLVLVRRDLCEAEYAAWEERVKSGQTKPYDSIELVIKPAFVFLKDKSARDHFMYVGSWKDAKNLKLEVLRRLSGLTKEEFEEAQKSNFWRYKTHGFKAMIYSTTQQVDNILVPFVSKKDREWQAAMFGQPTLEEARTNLFEKLPSPLNTEN